MLKRKVIFLDIDGVLNSTDWMIECAGTFDHPANQMDPKAVARLNAITDATGAGLVVSSTWRLAFLSRMAEPILSLQGCLKSYGITGDVIDMTPRCDEVRDNRRGAEIQAWLDSNPTLVDKFIIIDDDSDMGDLKVHHFKTIFQNGLIDEHIQQIIERLQ